MRATRLEDAAIALANVLNHTVNAAESAETPDLAGGGHEVAQP
jgi:hypothetical protein